MSNADRCARKDCQGLRMVHDKHTHAFVDPAPQPAPTGDEAKVLDMDDETLVAAIAFEVGQATKQQPEMGGRCRRLHDDAESRRIARAAIRAINAIARRGSEGK